LADIHIHREHALGLAKARKIAWKWAEEVEEKFDMACTVIEGETSDTVEFTRTGVHGRLIVAPDHFELDAKLGFLLGAFAGTIEREIRQNLDTLLGVAEAAAAGPKAAKPAKAAGTGGTAAKGPRTAAAAPLKRASTRPKTR
jgi:putative polyhydroxyalkanoate system protein